MQTNFLQIPLNDIYGPHWKPSKETLVKLEKDVGVKVTQKESDLNGQFRFVAENIMTESECKDLMNLILVTNVTFELNYCVSSLHISYLKKKIQVKQDD